MTALTDLVDKDRVVRTLAEDGWAHPVNRAVSMLVNEWMRVGYTTHAIYDAVNAAFNVLKDHDEAAP